MIASVSTSTVVAFFAGILIGVGVTLVVYAARRISHSVAGADPGETGPESSTGAAATPLSGDDSAEPAWAFPEGDDRASGEEAFAGEADRGGASGPDADVRTPDIAAGEPAVGQLDPAVGAQTGVGVDTQVDRPEDGSERGASDDIG